MSNSVLIVSVKWKRNNSTYGKSVFQNGKMIACTLVPSKFNEIESLALKLASSLDSNIKYHAHVFNGRIDWGLVISEVNEIGQIDYKLHA